MVRRMQHDGGFAGECFTWRVASFSVTIVEMNGVSHISCSARDNKRPTTTSTA